MAAPRMMAMAIPAQQSISVEEARRLVKPSWSAEMRFPKTVRVIVGVSNTVWGVGSGVREVVINRPDQELPVFIIQWMQDDPRYRTWFLQEITPAKEATQPEPKTLPAEQSEDEPVVVEVEPEAVGGDDPDDRDKPIKRGRRKKAADGDE